MSAPANKKLVNILFGIIMILLMLPALQHLTGLVSIGKLGGYEPIAQDVTLTKDGWLNSSYQVDKEKYIKHHFGFRNWFLRVDHQLAYSLYHKSKVYAVRLGKEGYLYDYDYIKAHNGEDFVGEDVINAKLDKFKKIQEALAAKGKHLFVIIGPNKADFFPEYLPDEYVVPREGIQTNYAHYIEGMKQREINHIDANGWFMQMKETSPYPLYPQTGIHFSFYGAALFADTIVSHIEEAIQKDLPDFGWSDVEWDEEPREEDDDLEEALNIMFNLPSYKLPYPKIEINEKGKYKPKTLTIGDSFFWRFVNWEGLTKLFDNGQFWYYNRDAHPSGEQVANLDFGEAIEEAEVIFIVMASVNFWRFGFEFDEQLYDYLMKEGQLTITKNDLEPLILHKMQEARENSEWMAHIEKQAAEKGMTIEEALRAEIEFVLKDPVALKKEQQIQAKIEEARNNPEWMAYIQKQADKKGISLNKALREEVEYALSQEAAKKE